MQLWTRVRRTGAVDRQSSRVWVAAGLLVVAMAGACGAQVTADEASRRTVGGERLGGPSSQSGAATAEDADSLLHRAWGHLLARRYALALSDFDKVLDMVPGSFSAVEGRGICYYETSIYELAAPDLDRALSLGGGDSRVARQAVVAAASLAIQNQEEPRAVKIVMEAMKARPRNAPPDEELLNLLGTAVWHSPPKTRALPLVQEGGRYYLECDAHVARSPKTGKVRYVGYDPPHDDAEPGDERRWGSKWVPAPQAEQFWRAYAASVAAIDAADAQMKRALAERDLIRKIRESGIEHRETRASYEEYRQALIRGDLHADDLERAARAEIANAADLQKRVESPPFPAKFEPAWVEPAVGASYQPRRDGPTVAVMKPAATQPSRPEDVVRAEAAVKAAEAALQHAVEFDREVIGARQRLAHAQSELELARGMGQAALQTKALAYQKAKLDEIAAVKAAASAERAALAQRQQELAALRGGASSGGDRGGARAQASIEAEAMPDSLPVAPLRVGDVEVSVLRVRVAPVSYTTAAGVASRSESLLGVLVSVANRGKTSVQYMGWNVNAVAKDELEREYGAADVPGGTILGRLVNSQVAPGGSLRDLIVFRRPPAGKAVTLVLPAFNVGGEGSIQFRVPADKVEESDEPLIDAKRFREAALAEAAAARSVASAAADPAGPRAVPDRQSADGVDFPPITHSVVRHGNPKDVYRLSDVSQLLLHPPGELAIKIFNTEKSKERLRARLSHTVIVQQRTDYQEWIKSTRVVVDPFDANCKWYALNVGGAEVAGLELKEGVTWRIVLYYHRSTVAQRMLVAAYGKTKVNLRTGAADAANCGPWSVDSTSGVRVGNPATKEWAWSLDPQESPARLAVDVLSLGDYESRHPASGRSNSK